VRVTVAPRAMCKLTLITSVIHHVLWVFWIFFKETYTLVPQYRPLSLYHVAQHRSIVNSATVRQTSYHLCYTYTLTVAHTFLAFKTSNARKVCLMHPSLCPV
jgi:hypothetical protein